MSDADQKVARTFTLEVRTPDGTIRGMLPVPPRPMRLSELALNVMAISDRLTGLAIKREAKEGRSVSCRMGCTACCYQIVPLSPPEAWLLADLVAAMPAPARSRTLAAYEAARAAYLKAGARTSGNVAFIDNEEALRVTIAYFTQHVPCPFLHEQACSIYENRPSICREFVVTSPAERCFRLPEDDIVIDRVQVPVRLTRALSRLTAHLLGREPEEIPLPLALDWVAEHREEGQRTWEAGALLRGLVAELKPEE